MSTVTNLKTFLSETQIRNQRNESFLHFYGLLNPLLPDFPQIIEVVSVLDSIFNVDYDFSLILTYSVSKFQKYY